MPAKLPSGHRFCLTHPPPAQLLTAAAAASGGAAQALAHLGHLHLSPQPQLPSEHLQAWELHMLQPVAATLLAWPPAHDAQKQSSLQSQLEPQLQEPPLSHLHTMVATLSL